MAKWSVLVAWESEAEIAVEAETPEEASEMAMDEALDELCKPNPLLGKPRPASLDILRIERE